MKKRILSLLLTVGMLLSILPMNLLAAQAGEVANGFRMAVAENSLFRLASMTYSVGASAEVNDWDTYAIHADAYVVSSDTWLRSVTLEPKENGNLPDGVQFEHNDVIYTVDSDTTPSNGVTYNRSDDENTSTINFGDSGFVVSEGFTITGRYNITVTESVANGGTVQVDEIATAGETVSFTVAPPTGYTVASVTRDGTEMEAGSNGGYSFEMPNARVTIQVTYEAETANEYSITVQPTTGGTVSPDKTEAAEGETVTLTVTPETGYQFGTVTVTNSNGTEVTATPAENGTYTFTMPADNVTVTAAFTAISYPISVTTTEGGTVQALVNGTAVTEANAGDLVTLDITASDGYVVSTVTMNGTEVPAENGAYTFTMPAGKAAVEVSFLADTAPAVAPTGDPEAVVDIPGLSDADQADIEAAIEEIEVDGSIAQEATNIADNISAEAHDAYLNQGADRLSDILNQSVDADSVTVVVRPYMSVTATEYDSADKNFVVNITAMYSIVATTETDLDQINDDPNAGAVNAVVLGNNEMTVSRAIQITIGLPGSFVTADNGVYPPVYVGHRGYEYTAEVNSVNSQLRATFTNPHGFSEFSFSPSSSAVASVDGTSYLNLQDAVNAIEGTAGTITLLSNNGTATVNRAVDITVIADGHTCTFTGTYTTSTDANGNTVYHFTASSGSNNGGGGGGGGGSSSYTITVSDTDNGSVRVSPTSASRGDTVTITVDPDAGYELDTLVVRDTSGALIDVERQSDTQYTFEMPARRVTIEATFVESSTESADLPFRDVSASAWYYDAVRYVYERGMMAGTGDNQFSPDATTTRAMIVTILYSLENRPAAGSADFTDVPSGQWYSSPIAWAAANGIVGGYGDGRFGPNDTITREQMAMILYRYAQIKGYDVSNTGDLSRYTDAGQANDWALTALGWANAQGLITGNTASTLNPTGSATRAEVATILMRFVEDVAG